MGMVGPARTFSELENSARTTRLGKGDPPLHGVMSDAQEMDRQRGTKHYQANRRLAKAIGEALDTEKLKKHNLIGKDGQPLFLLAWRLYPNKESKHWQNLHTHTCGCGCAGVAPKPKPKSKPKSKPKPKPRRR